MDNLFYQFGGNSGYKIHLPVIPDVNDPLTKQIAEYLDSIFGTTDADRHGFQSNESGGNGCYSKFFKIGNCSDSLANGKGMTIYGKVSTADEMRQLAQDIEAKFGKEILAIKKKHNIGSPLPDTAISSVITGRFNTCVQKGKGVHSVNLCGWKGLGDSNYNQNKNPSGAPTVLEFKDINGKVQDSYFTIKSPWNPNVNEIDKKFCWGASTMETIDHYGELFTGKIKNGKVPQFIMDGLPKEYLQHYNLTEKDIIKRINKGTSLFVANMLEDMVNTPNSLAFLKAPWMETLDVKVIDEAKQLLAQYEPQTVQKFEQILPQLEQKYPQLSVLKKTTPFSQMNNTPLPKPHNTPKPNTNVGGNSTKVGMFEKLGTKGKVGLAAAGTLLAAGTIYALMNHNLPKKSEAAVTNTSENQLHQQTQPVGNYQNLYKNNYYGYHNNPYQGFSL